MLSETDPAVIWIVAGPSHSTSTTPFAPGCRPWLHEVLELSPPEPRLPPPALLAGAPVATAVPGWLVAMVLPEPLPPTDAVAAPPPLVLADPLLLPMEPHPAMVSTTAVSSVALETTVVARDICFSSFWWLLRVS